MFKCIDHEKDEQQLEAPLGFIVLRLLECVRELGEVICTFCTELSTSSADSWRCSCLCWFVLSCS